MTYYCLTCSHLDKVAQPWFEHQKTSLKKWELRGLAEEHTEARESREDRLVADPENATISVIGAKDLWEFWSRTTSRPLPMPDTTVLSFLSLGPLDSSCMVCTSLLYSESLRLSCKLKAQQTPESVMTGVKMSEQLTSSPFQEHLLSMWGESGLSLEAVQVGIECQSKSKMAG